MKCFIFLPSVDVWRLSSIFSALISNEWVQWSSLGCLWSWCSCRFTWEMYISAKLLHSQPMNHTHFCMNSFYLLKGQINCNDSSVRYNLVLFFLYAPAGARMFALCRAHWCWRYDSIHCSMFAYVKKERALAKYTYVSNSWTQICINI